MGDWDRFPTGQNQAPKTSRDWNTYPTLGGPIKSAPQTEIDRLERKVDQDIERDAAARFESLSPGRRLLAQSRNVWSGVPVVGAAVDTNNPDVQDYQRGYPRSSAVSRGAAHTIPYVAVGAGLPQLMSTLPRAALTGATIEGANAAAEGQPIAPAAIGGAVSAIPGSLVGKVITPRSPLGANNAKWNRAISMSHQVRDRPEVQEAISMMNAVRGINATMASVPAFRGRTSPLPSSNAPIAREFIENTPPHQIPFNIPRVPPVVDVGAGMLGGFVGNLVSPGHAIAGAVAAPIATRVARRAANAGIRSINEGLRTPTGNALAHVLHKYQTNQLISPEARALIEAIGMPATQEMLPPQTLPTLTGQ